MATGDRIKVGGEFFEKLQAEKMESLEEQLIKSAKTFSELLKIIDLNQIEIKGSKELFGTLKLKNIITGIQVGDLPLHSATSREGLRAKIAELLETDKSHTPVKEIGIKEPKSRTLIDEKGNPGPSVIEF